jgi:hypothetical protein
MYKCAIANQKLWRQHFPVLGHQPDYEIIIAELSGAN